MAETEKEERDAKRNSNRVNMDTISPCLHSAISPSQGDIARVTSEKRISSINGFSELMIQSTINNSDDDDAESDPNSDPKISNYTINGISQQKIIQQPVHPKHHPRRNLSDCPSYNGGCARIQIDFGHAPYNALEVYCHGNGAQWCAHFSDSWGGKPDGQGWLHATGRQHHRSDCQVDSPYSNFNSTSNSPTRTRTQDIFNPIVPAGL